MLEYRNSQFFVTYMDCNMVNLQIPLDIPDVEILKIENNAVEDLIITVKSTKKKTYCRECEKEIDRVHGYGETLLLRHLSILERRVYIRLKPVRYICNDCDNKPTTTEQPDWYTRRSKFTKAYEEYLMRSLINSTVSDVARKEGVTCECVEGTLDRQVIKKVNWKEFKKLELLGFDEIALKKGHKDFVVIVSTRNEDEVKIIGILPDRKKKTVKAFIKSIPASLQKTVKTACTDMYDGYINAVKEVFGGGIKVVIDRFHVAKKYRECIDSLRKKELRRLKTELSDEEYKRLKGAMWALRKKPENLSDDEQLVLMLLFKQSQLLEAAYNLEKDLTSIFDANYNKAEASKRILEWVNKVENSEVECFDRFIKTLRNHWHDILNYFNRRGRKNSGFVEGLNNKIKVIKRRCYGIFDVESLFQRVFLDFQGYHLFGCKRA